MKKYITLTILALILALGCAVVAGAEVIPPLGLGQQIGYPAVVLCDELTLREKPSASAMSSWRCLFSAIERQKFSKRRNSSTTTNSSGIASRATKRAAVRISGTSRQKSKGAIRAVRQRVWPDTSSVKTEPVL